MKNKNQILFCLCAVFLTYHSVCLAECNEDCCGQPHDWSTGDSISADIVREHSQTWHEVGSATELWVDAEDFDTVNCCVNGNSSQADSLNYTWSGDYLEYPTDESRVTWKPANYTSNTQTISVTVSDQASIPDCDTGDRNDQDLTKEIQMGAFQAKASLDVSGSNSGGGNATAYELEYYDYTGDPCFVPADMKEISISLNSNTIALGNGRDHIIINPNPDEKTLSMVTSQADWTMACVPDNKWSADMDGTVSCTAGRIIDGNIVSTVMDEDSDSGSMDVTVSVSFGSPISISISKTFDLESDAARSQVAMGYGYQSEIAFGGAGYDGETEHKDDSNVHNNGDMPYTKTSSIDASYAETTFSVNRDGDKTARMKTQTEGWVKMVESKRWIDMGGFDGYWAYYDADVEAYQEGTATYKVGYPNYSGTKHSNAEWPFD